MVAYLRENYPDDFNDFVESSEYVALIDLIASPILGNTNTIEFLGLFSDREEPKESFERLQERTLGEVEKRFGTDVNS